MITNRERERLTLDFESPEERGAIEETFYPWTLTLERFKKEGLPIDVADDAVYLNSPAKNEKYFPVTWGKGVMEYERYMGFDPVRRIDFKLPFRIFEEKVIEQTKDHIIRQNKHGHQFIRFNSSNIENRYKSVVENQEDWEALKEHSEKEIEAYFSDEQIEKAYGYLKEGHDRGEYSIRMSIEGFFWIPRELLGIEEHLYAFYDEPELLHDINTYVLKIYQDKLVKVVELIQPDIVYFMEDLSGKNGPMLSPAHFDEFIGDYYRKIIPLLKEKGVGNVFVDTDGDFLKLIPNFIAAGVDGFLPMDVNAGMDILKVREQFPTLKFIGSFNKLMIAKGKEAIDAEFERLIPIIRQGGFIPGSDHQVDPSTSLENYEYYIAKLGKAMKEAGRRNILR